MFSILAPGKHIPPHTGPYKGVLRYHLGLLSARARGSARHPRRRPRSRTGREGESLVFDDTYEHEAWNDTDETRVVLFLDVVRGPCGPMKTFNAVVIKAIGYSPFIQDAKRRHQAWEERFAREAG